MAVLSALSEAKKFLIVKTIPLLPMIWRHEMGQSIQDNQQHPATKAHSSQYYFMGRIVWFCNLRNQGRAEQQDHNQNW